MGRRVAFETIKLIHAKVLCTIFDINYHPNIAHINMHGASVLVLYVGPYSYGELNYCDRLHILITFIYIITPLLTSTHKPVLARAPSSLFKVTRHHRPPDNQVYSWQTVQQYLLPEWNILLPLTPTPRKKEPHRQIERIGSPSLKAAGLAVGSKCILSCPIHANYVSNQWLL